MRLRSMAGVLLRCEGRILMMHRSEKKEISPGLWAIPGGHVEPCEMNDPLKTAVRELYEETGVSKEQLSSIALRYVIMATREGELRIHYNFVADMEKLPRLTESAEGTLSWLMPGEIPGLNMTFTMRELMGHYLNAPDDSRVHMGMFDGIKIEWTSVDENAIKEAKYEN